MIGVDVHLKCMHFGLGLGLESYGNAATTQAVVYPD